MQELAKGIVFLPEVGTQKVLDLHKAKSFSGVYPSFYGSGTKP